MRAAIIAAFATFIASLIVASTVVANLQGAGIGGTP